MSTATAIVNAHGEPIKTLLVEWPTVTMPGGGCRRFFRADAESGRPVPQEKPQFLMLSEGSGCCDDALASESGTAAVEIDRKAIANQLVDDDVDVELEQ